MDRSLFESGALPPKRAQRLRRFQRGIGSAILLGLVAWFVLSRVVQLGTADEEHLAQGAVALWAAIEGDEAAWARAEQAYGEAARGVVFDVYPVFALTLTQRLRAGDLSQVTPSLQAVAAALSAGDLPRAHQELEGVAADAPGRAWMAQLVGALARAADEKAAGPK